MTLPYARTYNEAILYIRLRPCGCAEMEAPWRDVPVMVAGQPARYFTATCANCGRPREFTIAMPDGATRTADVVFGAGEEPSHVIDPGEWMGICDLYGQRAEELLSDEEFGSSEELNVVYYALSARVAAVDEILKFLPTNADIVPEWLFRGITGRAIYEASPQRFAREALLAQRAALQANLERFVKDFTASAATTGDGTPAADDAERR
jgi:hypothetical protein